MHYDNTIFKVYLFSEFNFKKVLGENNVQFWVFLI